MKKYLYILFTVSLFTSCNNDNLFDKYGGEFDVEFAETNLSFIEVMSSADYWGITSIHDIFYSTAPNGKGERFYYKDDYSNVPVGGGSIFPIFSVLLENLRFYHKESAFPGIMPDYYMDKPYRIEDNKILFTSTRVVSVEPPQTPEDHEHYVYEDYEAYFKILEHDETNILIETNYTGKISEGVSYPYAIVLLHKQMPEDTNWRDNYVSFDEYHKLREALEEFMINGGNPKDFQTQ